MAEEVPVPKLNGGVNSNITVVHDNLNLDLNFPPCPIDEDEELIHGGYLKKQKLPLNKIHEYSPDELSAVMYPSVSVGEKELRHEQEYMRLDEWLDKCAQKNEYVEASPLPRPDEHQMNSGYDDEQSINNNVILPDLNHPYMLLEFGDDELNNVNQLAPLYPDPLSFFFTHECSLTHPFTHCRFW